MSVAEVNYPKRVWVIFWRNFTLKLLLFRISDRVGGNVFHET